MTQFIYQGQCQVRHEDIGTFLATGTKLEISGLMADIVANDIIKTKMENTAQHDTSENQRQSESRLEDIDTVPLKVAAVRKPRQSKIEGMRYDCDQCDVSFYNTGTLRAEMALSWVYN